MKLSLYLIGLFLNFFIATSVYKDAQRRGLASPGGWAFFTFILPLLAVLIYYLNHKSKIALNWIFVYGSIIILGIFIGLTSGGSGNEDTRDHEIRPEEISENQDSKNEVANESDKNLQLDDQEEGISYSAESSTGGVQEITGSSAYTEEELTRMEEELRKKPITIQKVFFDYVDYYGELRRTDDDATVHVHNMSNPSSSYGWFRLWANLLNHLANSPAGKRVEQVKFVIVVRVFAPDGRELSYLANKLAGYRPYAKYEHAFSTEDNYENPEFYVYGLFDLSDYECQHAYNFSPCENLGLWRIDITFDVNGQIIFQETMHFTVEE